MSETRERVASHVDAHPGVHFNGIVDALDLATGQVQYHLRKLRSQERVAVEELGGRTHYYPPDYDPWERQALALLRRETAGDVVGVLLEVESARPQAVADELDVARSTLEWHLDRLVEYDVVLKRRDRRNHVRLELARPAGTVDLLREADPDLFDRLVDRFSRLLDHLLSE